MIPTVNEKPESEYAVSVLIPVYNVDTYLEECMSSVINQSLGFEKIQVILINDGSQDNSGDICKRYATQYPNNVIYVEQENRGVACARNAGLELAEADLITFLDGDDKWSEDAFEYAYEAYTRNPNIGVFSCKMHFFDSEEGEHQLNYKYARDKTIDITKDYNYPQLSSSSVFLRKEVAKKYRFDTKVRFSEDCKYINELLLHERYLMMLEKPVYWYRKRQSGNSAMQRAISEKEYYTSTCRNVYMHLFDLSKSLYGKVLQYIQFCVMYDLRWRLKIPLSETPLSPKEEEEYCDTIAKLLQNIDDEIILNQQRMAVALKLFALDLKHKKKHDDILTCTASGIVQYSNYEICDIEKQHNIYIDELVQNRESMLLRGHINSPLANGEISTAIIINGNRQTLQVEESPQKIKTYLLGALKSNLEFAIEVPVTRNSEQEIKFMAIYKDEEIDIDPQLRLRPSTNKCINALKRKGIIIQKKEKNILLRRTSIVSAFIRKDNRDRTN